MVGDLGTAADQGMVADQGTAVDRGTAVDQGMVVDRGKVVDRGMVADRGMAAGRDRTEDNPVDQEGNPLAGDMQARWMNLEDQNWDYGRVGSTPAFLFPFLSSMTF